MASEQQRWLSLDGICATLGISSGHATWLAKNGYLVYMYSKGRAWKNARFLDPTPEYAQKLKFGEALYGRLYPIPKDIEMTGLLTISEIAEITGWTTKYAQIYITRNKIPAIKMGDGRGRHGRHLCNLYTVRTVRDILWRKDRKLSKQKSPFLIEDLIAFFIKYHARESEEVPTDIQFKEDDLLKRKLVRLTRMRDPSLLREFIETAELAKRVAAKLTG